MLTMSVWAAQDVQQKVPGNLKSEVVSGAMLRPLLANGTHFVGTKRWKITNRAATIR